MKARDLERFMDKMKTMKGSKRDCFGYLCRVGKKTFITDGRILIYGNKLEEILFYHKPLVSGCEFLTVVNAAPSITKFEKMYTKEKESIRIPCTFKQLPVKAENRGMVSGVFFNELESIRFAEEDVNVGDCEGLCLDYFYLNHLARLGAERFDWIKRNQPVWGSIDYGGKKRAIKWFLLPIVLSKAESHLPKRERKKHEKES